MILIRKDWCFTQFSTGMAGWLLLIFFICLHNQLSSIHSISTFYQYRCLENVIHQIDSKNGWLLLSVKFTAKFGLVFVLTLENVFLRGVTFKPTERAYVLLKKDARDFQNSPPFERSAWFYVTISENFEHFQYFHFETDFLENENFFHKTGVPFFSWTH